MPTRPTRWRVEARPTGRKRAHEHWPLAVLDIFVQLYAAGGSIMALPLEGIKIIDFTGVQAGPACTQLLAWFGADVLKVERPGVGDITRRQLRDVPNLDALYFTMLNSNKKSLTLNTKTPEGKAILEQLIREADVLVENFAPGALDRMGFSWERIQELNPRIIFGSIKGFN